MKKLIRSIALVLAVCLMAGLAVHITAVTAEAGVAAVEGAKYNTRASMEGNIRTFMGKTVTLLMNSGKEITGKVKSIESGRVHLEALAGKEYYDALVRISDVSAVIARFKEFK